LFSPPSRGGRKEDFFFSGERPTKKIIPILRIFFDPWLENGFHFPPSQWKMKNSSFSLRSWRLCGEQAFTNKLFLLLVILQARSMNEHDPIEYPIDGVLDLHTFKLNEVKDLISEYLTACRERNIFLVRIIHGKGTGTLRRTVQAILERIPEVASFHPAGEDGGGWGATLVNLRPISNEN
jgi:hypothetical protein